MSGSCLECNSLKPGNSNESQMSVDSSSLSPLGLSCDVKGQSLDLVLPTQELQLKADMHVLFETQQKTVERETVCVFDSLCCPERVDLMEVCTPWDSPLGGS